MHVVIAADPRISVRNSTAADEAFLLQLYALVRAAEIGAFGWEIDREEAFLQMQFTNRTRAYKMQFPTAEQLIIMVDDLPTGQLLLDRRSDEHHVIDIAIHASHQNLGIGSTVLSWILREARIAGKPVELKVDRTNGRAKSFYERHGFAAVSETELYFLMVAE